MKKIIILFFIIVLSACSSLKVAELDPNTGLFPSETKATLVLNKPIDLDTRKALILIPDHDFDKGQVENIRYFDKTITIEELETLIVKNNLTDKVPSVRDRIGVNNAAKHYKPFLWLRFDTRGSGNEQHAQLILTDPVTLDDYFITETHLDYIWAGVNDQNNWYPMYNSFIEYIKQNSNTYK